MRDDRSSLSSLARGMVCTSVANLRSCCTRCAGDVLQQRRAFRQPAAESHRSDVTTDSTSKFLWTLQAAFIYGGATVRDNILFGLPWDEERYNHSLEVSSLVDDLLQMPGALLLQCCQISSIHSQTCAD